ncbi:n-acetylglutamate synthase [Paenibacillus sp. MBLB4367]|uniref:n-acetylglutamate synthase n=1 Tax=Paenibacillus sp. MBLB4367 TaxID=3384767 RepID=UPI0039082A34
MAIPYNNLSFKAINNTDNGETSSETIFHYKQDGSIISATYSGGSILSGTLVGIVREDDTLHFRYSHVNDRYQLRSGICTSTPEIMLDGRIRLHEKWQWTVDEHSEGESIIEQIK